jgi:PHD-zinc-finger like domain
MSFPWAHPKEPIFKAIPRDIDELPGILSIGEGSPEHEAHGKFRHLKGRGLPKNTQAAARRSVDPGVVELTTFFKPTQAQRHLAYSPSSYDQRVDDSNVPGELSLRMYQEVQERKRRRVGMETANKKTRLISFRLASTSSRSSIFDVVEAANVPLFLLATLPRQVQEGTRKNGIDAFELACDLGSYNCRPPPTESSVLKDPTSNNRFFVGRTRLIWSERERRGPQSQRAAYRSLLTGERLEQNTLKRPLRVKVAIRLNGTLLSSPDELLARKSLEELVTAYVSDPAYSRSEKVNDALDAACGEIPSVGGDHSQSSLSSEKLFSNVAADLKRAASRQPSNLLDRIREPLSLLRESVAGSSLGRLKRTFGKGRLNIVPPRIDCLPTEDGLVSVACSAGGRIVWESLSNRQTLYSASTMIMRELASETGRCVVCWSVYAELVSSVQCAGCDLRVHTRCLANRQVDDAWMCQTCREDVEKSATGEPLCHVCHHTGGAVVRHEEDWVHDVCRTWCEIDQVLGPCDIAEGSKGFNVCCHLCSEGSKLVVQCAAENCSVRFHPMCAVVVSIAAEIQHKELVQGGAKERDAFLCTQYTLSMLHTSFADSSRSMAGDGTTLPVAFCGYHNPKRQADFYGLYAGGYHLDGAMRIPPNRSKTVSFE